MSKYLFSILILLLLALGVASYLGVKKNEEIKESLPEIYPDRQVVPYRHIPEAGIDPKG